MDKRDNKKWYFVIGIFGIIFTFFGGTLSYWQWTTSDAQRTAVNFTIEDNFSCSVDGGGDVSSTDKKLAPASCTNEKYAIQRTITASANITGIDTNVSMDLWLDVKAIDPELSQSANFKYALTSNPDSCTEGVLESGTFTGKTANSTASILNDKIFTASGSETYYLYIWLDAAETNSNTMDKTFNLELNGNCVNIPVVDTSYKETLLNGADPVLDDGMIPITLSSTGVATVADTSSEWYNYEEKEWANIVLVNELATDGVDGSQSREYYLNNPGVEVLDSDILAYYVWIPRYSYKVWLMDGTTTSSPQTIDIRFESQSDKMKNATKVGDYMTHPAFWWDKNSDGVVADSEMLPGIWVGKFETTGTADKPTVLPNETSLREQTVSEQFITSLKFAGGVMDASTGDVSFRGNNTYGLTTQMDSHMMKNSEWGVVAYLSHSQYGINSEIYINNSSEFYTGRSGGNVVGSVNTLATQFPDSQTSTNQYNSYGYYTWTGQAIGSDGTIGEINDSTLGTKASTTGNVTGVYDMSGGSWEYVMGVLSDTNGNPRSGKSGFNGSRYNGGTDETITDGITFPNSKYYVLYLQSQFNGDYSTNMQLCTLETCGGHALYETYFDDSNWYNDYAVFVEARYPWFGRGGDWGFDVYAGAFSANDDNGNVSDNAAWRSVVVRGDGA